MHSDFQPQRFFKKRDNGSDEKGNQENLNMIYDLFKEMIFKLTQDNDNDLLKAVYLIQCMLKNISKDEFLSPEGFDKFMACLVVLKQVGSIRTDMSDLFVPIKSLFKESNKNSNKSKINDNDNDKQKFKLITDMCINHLLDDQKYINNYTVPVLIFNDSDTSFQSNDFWEMFISKLSRQIYLIFLYKAIKKLNPYYEFKQNLFFIDENYDEQNTNGDNKDKDGNNKNDDDIEMHEHLNDKANNVHASVDYLDYSPILSETCIVLKKNDNKSNTPKMKNLSIEISKILVEYFKEDLKKISKMVNSIKMQYGSIIFEIASSLFEILKIANSLLYESGAEIPPLSFIWKRLDEFKLNLKDNVFLFINNSIIQQNLPYNFETHTFLTKKKLDGMAHKIHESVPEKKYPSVFRVITSNLDLFSSRNENFGIDLASSIASLIGEKQISNIMLELINQLKEKTEEFCKYYKNFITKFNFKVDVNNENQNFYAIKEYLDSFITYFNLSDSKDVITCISQIGNIIALIILFDSAIASEFIPKFMISSSIDPSGQSYNFPFSMYMCNQNLDYKNPNFFSRAIQIIYKIINSPENRINFDEINGHSGFYQFAISLIYASSNSIIPTSNQPQLQSQSQNNTCQSNPLINSSDSISISCSIILEVLSQYDLYGYSNILQAFLLFNDNNNDNFDNANDNNDEINKSYNQKLKSNLQIIDIFHYILAGFSFPSPNHLINCKRSTNFEIPLELVSDLLRNRCEKVAILISFQENDEQKITKKDNCKNENENIKNSIKAIKKKIRNTQIENEYYCVLSIKLKRNDNSNGDNNFNKVTCEINDLTVNEQNNKENDELISPIRSLSHQEFGRFCLLIFRKKRLFNEESEINENYIININENFPYIIDNENYLTPKKGRIPMSFHSLNMNLMMDHNKNDLTSK